MPASLLPSMLHAVAEEPVANLPEGMRLSEGDAEWLMAIGLAPLAQAVRPASGYDTDPRTAARLHGAELTARVLAATRRTDVGGALDALRIEGLEPIPLKGFAFAERYYPEPHLRTMSDVDLLVRPEEIVTARAVLAAMGFVEPPTPWSPGHHAPPLHHVEKGIWLELHQALRPTACPASAEPAFVPESVARESVPKPGKPDRTACLSPELDLALIAVGWCYDLKTRFGRRALQRPLVDAARLLARLENELDEDLLTAWSEGTYTGACLTILLGYLDRCGAYRGPPGLPGRVREAQDFVSSATLAAIHLILDRYLVRSPRPDRPAAPVAIGRALDALITPRPPWRSIVSAPVNVAFPARDPERFRPGTVLRRVRTLLSKTG